MIKRASVAAGAALILIALSALALALSERAQAQTTPRVAAVNLTVSYLSTADPTYGGGYDPNRTVYRPTHIEILASGHLAVDEELRGLVYAPDGTTVTFGGRTETDTLSSTITVTKTSANNYDMVVELIFDDPNEYAAALPQNARPDAALGRPPSVTTRITSFPHFILGDASSRPSAYRHSTLAELHGHRDTINLEKQRIEREIPAVWSAWHSNYAALARYLDAWIHNAEQALFKWDNDEVSEDEVHVAIRLLKEQTANDRLWLLLLGGASAAYEVGGYPGKAYTYDMAVTYDNYSNWHAVALTPTGYYCQGVFRYTTESDRDCPT